MDNEKKYNYYKEANDRIYEQLNFAEAKNGVLVGLYTAIIFGLINLFFECLPCWGKIILSISLGFMAIGMIICILSFIPNVKTLKNERNLFFWGDIAKLSDFNEYDSLINKEEILLESLAKQNIHVAKIVAKKNKIFSISINYLFAGIFPLHIIGAIIITIKLLIKK